jgi:hypothetical protein
MVNEHLVVMTLRFASDATLEVFGAFNRQALA